MLVLYIKVRRVCIPFVSINTPIISFFPSYPTALLFDHKYHKKLKSFYLVSVWICLQKVKIYLMSLNSEILKFEMVKIF